MPCEQAILDIAVLATTPDPAEYVLITQPTGTSYLRTVGNLLGDSAPLPSDETYVAQGSGGTTNNVLTGTATFTLTSFVDRRVRLYRGGLLQATVQVGTNSYYTFNSTTGVFTVTPVPSVDEIFQIQAY